MVAQTVGRHSGPDCAPAGAAPWHPQGSSTRHLVSIPDSAHGAQSPCLPATSAAGMSTVALFLLCWTPGGPCGAVGVDLAFGENAAGRIFGEDFITTFKATSSSLGGSDYCAEALQAHCRPTPYRGGQHLPTILLH